MIYKIAFFIIWLLFFNFFFLIGQNRNQRVIEIDSISNGKDHKIIVKYPLNETKKNKINRKVIKEISLLPNFWIPLFKYGDTLCTYKPCDGIFQYHIGIGEDKLNWINYDENISFQFLKIDKISDVEWKLFFVEETKIPLECNLLLISKGYLLTYEDQIYINKEATPYFHEIINQCTFQKWAEFTKIQITDLTDFENQKEINEIMRKK